MKEMSRVDKAKIDPAFKTQLGKVIDEYITLKDALSKDDAVLAQQRSKNIKNAMEKVDMFLLTGDAHTLWMNNLKTINSAIETIQNTKNIELQRKVFIELSQELVNVISDFGINTVNKKPLYLEFCPMANNDNGAYWLSYDKEIKNPYFGAQMLSCGEITKTFN